MSNKIILKKSSVTTKKPLVTDLEFGEVALNYADGYLYFKNSSNQIEAFASRGFSQPSTNSSVTFQTDSGNNPVLNIQVGGTTIATFGGGQVTFQVPLSMNGNTITGVGAPLSTTDAVNKAYADGATSSGSYPKGDYGSLDAVAAYDAFGVSIVPIITYDNMTPVGIFLTADFGTSLV
jgi:hypothetical protein